MYVFDYYWICFADVIEINLQIYLARIQEHSPNIQEPTHEDTRYKWKPRREKTKNFRLKMIWRKATTPYCIRSFVGCYLKRSSNSNKFIVGCDPLEALTSTGYNMFFIMLQHRKGKKSLNHNIKSQMMVTLYLIPMSSILLHFFFFSTLCLFCCYLSAFLCRLLRFKKVMFPFHIVYFISNPYGMFLFFAGIWNEALSLGLPKIAHKLIPSFSVLKEKL